MNLKTSNKQRYCPCGSKKNATECCLVFIDKIQIAPTAELLMRSRYTAYALEKSAYILDTWHNSTRPQSMELDSSVEWTGLTVLNCDMEKADVAYVEFIARFNNSGTVGEMHERSRFFLEGNCWFYVDGEQFATDNQVKRKQTGRNEPCYCGSGKKFKKCCGANS
ncbi:MAG: hypothetical protein DIZ80_08895 [endosymbiont of Galathealinum brachiosum]|uniref:YchJ-like middle NTF2-like domain-containing protein n=1 Tax=endosymbiont of Galathealinum brachiosum TaxID=2200906 RepID=A0A370DBW4_9GAMM|nr:MAG: hypothetical protein DIZ80_08895 [endosymbiont of Galathealinum brachiosum]